MCVILECDDARLPYFRSVEADLCLGLEYERAETVEERAAVVYFYALQSWITVTHVHCGATVDESVSPQTDRQQTDRQ